MFFGKRLFAVLCLACLSGALTNSRAFADPRSTTTPTFNIEDIIGKPKTTAQPAEQPSDQPFSEGILTERVSQEMFDEIDRAFQKHFQLATGPTPEQMLKELAPPQRVLDHDLKQEFCRYGILSAQYASYGKTKEAMSVYNWLEHHYKKMLAPDNAFFRELSCAVGLYLCAAGDYKDSITCLDNALNEPMQLSNEKQRVAFVMTNFGLARNYHKLGDDKQGFKYLAQAKAVNDITKEEPAPQQASVSPPRSRYHAPRLLPSGYVHR
jgi:hypothetical protein